MKTTNLKWIACALLISVLIQGCSSYKNALKTIREETNSTRIRVNEFNQVNEFRIITNKYDTLYGRINYDGKKYNLIDSKGNIRSYRPSKLISIREEINGWEYFEWGSNGFTDYLNIKVDSKSQDELFLQAKEWIKDCYISTNHGFYIEQNFCINDSVRWAKDLPRIIPELKYKFSINEKNHKITLVGYNELAFGTITSSHPNPIAFYTIELKFFEGAYQIDPVDLFYCYSYNSQIEEPEYIWDLPDLEYLLYYGKVYYVNIPLSDSKRVNTKNERVRMRSRCLVGHVEVLFNNLNRSLFNYINETYNLPNIFFDFPRCIK